MRTLLLALTLLLAGCAPHYLKAGDAGRVAPGPPARSVTQHVVLVSVDGLRPDAIDTYGAPTLQRLAREGSFTLRASTILPSKTLPSHTSMLTGVPPEQHGVMWNTVTSRRTDHIAQGTVFGAARARGYVTAAFFSKPKFQPLQLEGSLDYSQAPGGWWGGWKSIKTVADVEHYLSTGKPNLLFVHLPDPDFAGHSSGWMSDAYGRAVHDVDVSLTRLIAASESAFGSGNYTLIVTADHGGHGNDHGSEDPRDVRIPWIVWGRGVKASHLPDDTIRTMDTASTVLWLLGVDEPTDWAGSPVTAAFVSAVAP